MSEHYETSSRQSVADEIVRLDQFYHEEAGRLVADFLRQAIAPQIAHHAHIDRLGFGYPFMAMGDESFPVLIPSEMGALAYGQADGVMTASVDSHAWPIAGDSFNQILMCHGLEFCHDPEACLAEAHRVLVSAGELVLMVPNRRSLWVRDDRTPLGHGRPFSKGQITKLLTKTGFTITKISSALLVPPRGLTAPFRIAKALDHLGHYGWRMFGGVFLIKATKLTYAKTPKPNRGIMVSLSGALRPAGALPLDNHE